VEERNFTMKIWSNATFAFLLDKFENTYWESNMEVTMKQNFVISMNTHSPTNV